MHNDPAPDDRASGATRSGVDRRTVIHGLAWSLPVVSVAVAAPLAAASVGDVCGSLLVSTEPYFSEGDGISLLKVTFTLLGGDPNAEVQFTFGGNFFYYGWGFPVKTGVVALNGGVYEMDLVGGDPGETASLDVVLLTPGCDVSATIQITDPNPPPA